MFTIQHIEKTTKQRRHGGHLKLSLQATIRFWIVVLLIELPFDLPELIKYIHTR